MQKQASHTARTVNEIEDDPKMAVTLGRNVKWLRERGRINKTRFAAMIGIGRPLLNKIEKGTANVRLSLVEELADALETTPEELLFERFDSKTIAATRKCPSWPLEPLA